MHEAQSGSATSLGDRKACLKQAAEMVGVAGELGQSMSILWIDIDRFRQVNESFGYDGGDQVIALISARLREKIQNIAGLSRVGADEFVCLAMNCDIQTAEKLGIELMRAIELPVTMGEFNLRLTASMGIAGLEAEESASEFLERADWAKNTAKKEGGNHYVISGSERMPSHMGIIQAREDLEVEYLLHTALDSGGLQLHYQPILGFDGHVLSVEGLMRCTVNGKNIPPARFFPVAEKSGLIVRLGEWSLLQGTRQARHLNQSGFTTTVSINISRGQLADPRFTQTLNSAVILANVEPGLIELELSESVFIDTSLVVQANLRAVKEMGVNLAIDNFGTGFSCLANLRDIPASKLKLGRAFIMALPGDRRSMSVVKAMVQLGQDLGMTVIAEGVETKEQIETLRELNVDGIQGYYYARPMDGDALTSWLRDREYA